MVRKAGAMSSPSKLRLAMGMLLGLAFTAILVTLDCVDLGDMSRLFGEAPQRQAFSKANLEATAKRILPQFVRACGDMDQRFEGINKQEGLALAAAATLAEVDVFIESGTASGFSTEILARFLANTTTRIYSIDSDEESLEQDRGMLSEAAYRLKPYPNVDLIRGDSLDVIPRLLRLHRGKRIGVFVDGPKAKLGVTLCYWTLWFSRDVKFVAQHDVRPEAVGKQMTDFVIGWGRTVLATWRKDWHLAYAQLDECPAKEDHACGWGLAVYAGIETVPMGTAGDEAPELDHLWAEFHRPWTRWVAWHMGSLGGR